MILTSAVVRTFLIVDMVGLSLLALFYLRQRQMNWVSYCCWGVLAIAVPVLGPFLVIVNRPGRWNPDFSIFSDMERLLLWMQRLLPDEPLFERKRKKSTMAERVRRRRQSKARKAPK